MSAAATNDFASERLALAVQVQGVSTAITCIVLKSGGKWTAKDGDTYRRLEWEFDVLCERKRQLKLREAAWFGVIPTPAPASSETTPASASSETTPAPASSASEATNVSEAEHAYHRVVSMEKGQALMLHLLEDAMDLAISQKKHILLIAPRRVGMTTLLFKKMATLSVPKIHRTHLVEREVLTDVPDDVEVVVVDGFSYEHVSPEFMKSIRGKVFIATVSGELDEPETEAQQAMGLFHSRLTMGIGPANAT
jgi:hypothetical protein